MRIEAAAQKRYVDHSTVAQIYAALGAMDEALKALEQAYAARSQPLMAVWFVTEFTSLQGDPRYRALMEKICGGLKPTGTP